MADKHQLDLLKKGITAWNAWKVKHASLDVALGKANLSGANLRGVDLSGADLSQADLRGADLSQANLRRANLSEAYLSEAYLLETDMYKAMCRKANLREANLSKANLRSADLRHAILSETNLSLADLRQAHLSRANLSHAYLRGAILRQADLSDASLRKANLSAADLSKANLSGSDLIGAMLRETIMREANLRRANLSEADLHSADLTGSAIYALSAWGLHLKNTVQNDLLITRVDEPPIMVDTLKIAQFIALLLEHEDLRGLLPVLVTTFAVLVGSFTPERKASLEALKKQLRLEGYVPVVIDVKKASNRIAVERIRTLAQLARYLIVDLTDAPHLFEVLQRIEPVPPVPVRPLLSRTAAQSDVLADEVRDCNWMRPLYLYDEKTIWSSFLDERTSLRSGQEVLA